MVEHAAVNRGVAGSSPARGARMRQELFSAAFCFIFVLKVFYTYLYYTILQDADIQIRLRGQEVKTSPFHGGNTGSIPVGVTSLQFAVIFGSLAQLVRATGS